MKGTKELWNEALAYVEKWKGALINRAKKCLHYATHLDKEDFLSEARVICFQTLQDLQENICLKCSNKKDRCFHDCEEFIKRFWGRVKARFYEISDDPCIEEIDHTLNSKAPAKKYEISEIYNEENHFSITLSYTYTFEDYFNDNGNRNGNGNGTWKPDEKLKEKLFRILNEKEKKLIILLEEEKSLSEIQKILKYKHKQGILMKTKAIQQKLQKVLNQPEQKQLLFV